MEEQTLFDVAQILVDKFITLPPPPEMGALLRIIHTEARAVL